MVAVGRSVAPGLWRAQFDELMGSVAGWFARVEPRAAARAFVEGPLAPIGRKNCWWLAGYAGHGGGPQAMQRLLRTARWDADGVRDDLRGYVAGRPGHPDGMLMPMRPGSPKRAQGRRECSASTPAPRGGSEQSGRGVRGVCLTTGRALTDRRLYLPKTWCADAGRRAGAQIPADVTFAAKPDLALRMILDALEAGIPARWVTGDEVYGAGARMRGVLEDRGAGYVLAVACDHRVSRARTSMRACRQW